MKDTLEKLLNLQNQREELEDQIHPLISKWLESTDKWYSYVESWNIEDDLSIFVRYSTSCWGSSSTENQTIPKEYFLSYNKDEFIKQFLIQKEQAAEAERIADAKLDKEKQEKRDAAEFERLKKKFQP